MKKNIRWSWDQIAEIEKIKKENDLQEKPLEDWLNDNLVFVCNSFKDLFKIAYQSDY